MATFDLLENIAGRGGPNEWLWIGIVGSQVIPDRLDEVRHIPEDASPESLNCEIPEEPLDHVEPRRAGRREMNMEALMPLQPRRDLRVFVGRMVVADDVDLLASWSGSVDQVEEFDPLLMPVLLHARANDLPVGDI